VIARRLIVSGRVQGVGFRFFAERAARELALAGFVRNLPNGAVEAVAEGEEEAIVRYVERLREGPRMGRVTDLRVEEIAVSGYREFEITA
jgi:acylphosphatase